MLYKEEGMKKSLFVALIALGVVGYFAACAMAGEGDSACGKEGGSDVVKEVVMAGPDAVAAGTEAAAPAIGKTAQAVAEPVAEAASAVAAPLTGESE